MSRLLSIAIVLAGLAWLCCGCLGPRCITHRYSWGNIIRCPQRETDAFCLRETDEWDDGSPVLPGQHSQGCYDRASNDIHIVNDCRGAEALPHEFAHQDGVAEPDKVGYDWEDRP